MSPSEGGESRNADSCADLAGGAAAVAWCPLLLLLPLLLLQPLLMLLLLLLLLQVLLLLLLLVLMAVPACYLGHLLSLLQNFRKS
ncbi:hypothetical protein JKP88DRAFT_309777 [Tribonema minus]|uniref:Uncharacterized protein n=1 Tax=Tribonema minus TaxID=303371 RepID=A0A835Z7D1_9STRA|nr:hypothetical protein JKP88DRAFT_309777 [Tribonema minus]